MKIAMFTDAYFPRINGVAVSVRSYAGELTKLGHEVAVVCLEYSEEQQRTSSFDEKSNDRMSPFK
ncbi:MAG: glycosyltransferase family 4 protein, partial [Treponema sp.]|nr:glycosyltransferase family 4 protein [Treponema sp.]